MRNYINYGTYRDSMPAKQSVCVCVLCVRVGKGSIILPTLLTTDHCYCRARCRRHHHDMYVVPIPSDFIVIVACV